jgi:hypothetical protein
VTVHKIFAQVTAHSSSGAGMTISRDSTSVYHPISSPGMNGSATINHRCSLRQGLNISEGDMSMVVTSLRYPFRIGQVTIERM